MTKTEFAARTIRELIRSGALAPGERLMVEKLKLDLGMSPTPIREALRSLQADGLVAYRPHHGIFVATLSAAEVEEVFRLRSTLEPEAVERAVELMDDTLIVQLRKVHQELTRAAERGDAKRFAEYNSRWHWTLYRAAQSPRLEDFIERLWEAFPWRIFGAIPGRTERTGREHSEIEKAVAERDGPAAAALMREHINNGRDTLLARMREVEEQAGLE
jgi:DNA-binding GntR family transcriptional regulator